MLKTKDIIFLCIYNHISCMC